MSQIPTSQTGPGGFDFYPLSSLSSDSNLPPSASAANNNNAGGADVTTTTGSAPLRSVQPSPDLLADASTAPNSNSGRRRSKSPSQVHPDETNNNNAANTLEESELLEEDDNSPRNNNGNVSSSFSAYALNNNNNNNSNIGSCSGVGSALLNNDSRLNPALQLPHISSQQAQSQGRQQ